MEHFYHFLGSIEVKMFLILLVAVLAKVLLAKRVNIQLAGLTFSIILVNVAIFFLPDIKPFLKEIQASMTMLASLVVLSIGIASGTHLDESIFSDKKVLGTALLPSILIFALTFFLSLGIFYYFEHQLMWVVSAGVAIFGMITGLPFVYFALQKVGKTDSPEGKFALAICTIKEVMIRVLVGILIAVSSGGSPLHIAINLLIFAVFVSFVIVYFKPWINKYLFVRIQLLYESIRDKKEHGVKLGYEEVLDRYGYLLWTLFLGSLFGLVAEYLQLHAFLGFLLAGMIVPHSVGVKIEKDLGLMNVMLALLYFVVTGTKVIIEPSILALVITLLIIFVSLFSNKIVQWMTGSQLVGETMSIKGMIAIIAANVLFDKGILPVDVYNGVMISAVLLTLWFSRLQCACVTCTDPKESL